VSKVRTQKVSFDLTEATERKRHKQRKKKEEECSQNVSLPFHATLKPQQTLIELRFSL